MQLVLERRAERSAVIAVASPLIAVALTLVTFAILFAIMGKNPIEALYVYFIDPLTDPFTLQEIAVKATPLVMIAVGLSLCYIANIWNIGAEGQFIVGAVCGSWLAVRTNGTDVRLLGAAGHAAPRRARRRALCADSGDLPGVFRRQRNPHQPDAGLCRQSRHGLSGARPVARSAGAELPDHGGLRSGGDGADPVRGRRPPACRLDHRAGRRDAGDRPARAARSWDSRSGWSARRRGRRAFPASTADRLVLFTFADFRRARRACRHHRGGGTDRPSAIPACRLGLRLHRDHRRLSRPAQSGRHPDRRAVPRADLHRRRRRADLDEGPARPHQGVSGHPAVLRARLRFADRLPRPPGAARVRKPAMHAA